MFKTFSFKDPANGGKDKPVETRLIRRIADTGKVTEQWQFAVWEWNAAGDAATLVNEDRFLNPIPREVTVEGENHARDFPISPCAGTVTWPTGVQSSASTNCA